MKIGVLVNNFGGFPETGRGAAACVDLALHAERLGFASVWVTDHVVLPVSRRTDYPHNDSGHFPYTWEQEIHEPLTLMAAIAQVTERVEIGVSVLVIPYRHPLTTAKMLATADQLSAGRVVLGAGVGWLRDEFEALGIPPEQYEKRGAVTVDFLRAMKVAWTESPASYQGPYVAFKDIGTRPHPVRAPHPPIWVGGQGDRALRRAVELGDGYLAISSNPERLRGEVTRLRELAERAGRSPETLTVGHIDGIVFGEESRGDEGASLSGSTPQILDGLRAYSDAGLQHIAAGVSVAGQYSFAATVDALERAAEEILPVVAAF